MAAHRSDLFEVAITAPGADSTNGIACAVVLPDRGAMNATTVSSHDAYTAGPGRPPGRISRPSASPACGRVDRPRVGAGQGPAQARGGPGDRQPGQRPHPRIAGQRRDRIPRRRPTAARSAARATDGQHGRREPISTTAVTVTATVGVCGHACPVRPCSDVTGEFHAERFRRATRHRRGEPGCGPDQPDQRDQRPAARSAPPSRPPSRPARPTGRGPSARLTTSSPSWLSRIAWSVS